MLNDPRENTLILAPNQPLAQQLRHRKLLNASASASASANDSAERDSPEFGTASILARSDIFVLSTWLLDSLNIGSPFNTALTNNAAARQFANDMQLRLIAEQALAKTQGQFENLNPQSLAPQTLKAWRNIKRYNVSLDELRQAEVGQRVRFSDTFECIDEQLKSLGLTTVELAIEASLASPSTPVQATPVQATPVQATPIQSTPTQQPVVYLYAFIEPPPPLFRDWLAACFSDVVDIDYSALLLPDIKQNNPPTLFAGKDQDDELCAAVEWAATTANADPEARVGIIYPDLIGQHGGNYAKVKRLLDVAVSSSSTTITCTASVSPPASTSGAICSALGLLQLNRQDISNADARFIIHSPFWGNLDAEYHLRAAWDKRLCHKQKRRFKPELLCEWVAGLGIESEPSGNSSTHTDTSPTKAINTVEQRLLAFSETKRRQPNRQSPFDWACLFQRQLDLLEWSSALNTRGETQALQTWYDTLRDFSLLGKVAGNISIDDALRLLQRCCDTPATNPGSAHRGIRLLDTVESATDYTHLWLIGVDQSHWPNPPSPNPLLPVGLQIRAGMPAADHQAEVALAKRLLERLPKATHHLVLSYAQSQGDVEQQPSALLSGLEAFHSLQASTRDGTTFLNTNKSKDKDTDQSKGQACYSIELIDSDRAPPLLDHECEVHAGAALLKTMAISPFSAFAQWRLGAEPLPEPKIGLDGGERGTLVHWVLDDIWKHIQTSTKLQSLSDKEITALCETSAEKQVNQWQIRHGWLKNTEAMLEIQRLTRTVQSWLTFERQREPFEQVGAENALMAHIGTLRFQMRLDRLDKLADGSLLLIDYKTGQLLTKKSWQDEPPTDPQLPLYAISLEQAPDAICFAKVRPDEMRFIGIGQKAASQGIEAIENWDALLIQWRESLTVLANAFSAGHTDAYDASPAFQQKDPLASLHRLGERDQLMAMQQMQQMQQQQQLNQASAPLDSDDIDSKQGERDV